MINALKKLITKKKEDSFLERGLKALEFLKHDTRVMPMKEPSVKVEVKDLTNIAVKLDILSYDIRKILTKIGTLEMTINKIEKQVNEMKKENGI